MTVAATATTDYTVDQIVKLAMVTAGVLNSEHFANPPAHLEHDLAIGRMWLWLDLQAIPNSVLVLRARERATVSLTASQAHVDLDADTLSVEKGLIVRNTDGDADRMLELYTLERYQDIPDKTVEGMPNFYYPEQRSDGTWRIFFYPVPDADWPTAIVPRTRRLRDVEDGSVTLDLTPKWYLSVLNALAAKFARAKGRRDLAREIKDEHREERDRVEMDETTRGDSMLVIDDWGWP